MKSLDNTTMTQSLDTATTEPTTAPITTTDLLKALRPDFATLAIPQKPDFDSTFADVERLIHTLCHQYTDQTCVQLHTDELIGNLWEKYSRLLAHKDIFRFTNRVEFFRYVKTALHNHIRGLVQRYRFTQKRTGISSDQRRRNEELGSHESMKPIEISLDDDEAHLQVGQESFICDEAFEHELISHIEAHLNPIERFVFQQLRLQSLEAAVQMELESARGRKTGGNARKFDIDATMAKGVGLPQEVWDQVVQQVKRKVLPLMKDEAPSSVEVQYNKALTELEALFGVQVPRSLDKIDVRRLFTVAAREQFNKVGHDDQVQQNLKTVGALVPETHGLTMACYAVLYNAGEKVCQACQINAQCRNAANHFGFVDIPYITTASLPRSGQDRYDRYTRTAHLLPIAPKENIIFDETPSSPLVHSERDTEILLWLKDHCSFSDDCRAGHRPQRLYRPKSGPGPVIFSQFLQSTTFELRVCAPSDALKSRLVRIKNGYYLSADLDATTAIQILDAHISERTLRS